MPLRGAGWDGERPLPPVEEGVREPFPKEVDGLLEVVDDGPEEPPLREVPPHLKHPIKLKKKLLTPKPYFKWRRSNKKGHSPWVQGEVSPATL